jgi:HD-GYP domain-containing protein (c-di-GMP phosphodiesterase class II)
LALHEGDGEASQRPFVDDHEAQSPDVTISVSRIVSALSYALDLTEGQPMGHSVRTCIIGLRIAEKIGVPLGERSDLYYALLLKDAGCSSNSSRLFHTLNADEIRAKADVKTTDWTRIGWESLRYALTHVAVGRPFAERVRTLVRVASRQQEESWKLVKIRCERGASVARQMGFGEPVAQAIHSLDEHWNGGGYPDGRRGEEIPLFARIMLVAQTLDVFFTHRSADAAVEVIRKRSRRWFDPALVSAAGSLAKCGELWKGLDSKDLVAKIVELEPKERSVPATEDQLDSICQAFAEVIDSKSPFTYRHSNGVAEAAACMAQHLGFGFRSVRILRRAALLHDIGQLGVTNAILEKPDKLNSAEWAIVRKHPYHTYEILRRAPGFRRLSRDAASHHERLDGSGYCWSLRGEEIRFPARMLAVADVFKALSSTRPHRDAFPEEMVFRILAKEARSRLDPLCVEALMTSLSNGTDLILGSYAMNSIGLSPSYMR